MRPQRLQRSTLAVPATEARFLASAARSAADAVFLDLEDAIAPVRKLEARACAIEALDALDWGNKLVSVRVNDLGSETGVRDILEIAAASRRLDTVLVPKVATRDDVVFVERLLAAAERPDRGRPIGIEALVETPMGLANVEAIAAASERLESLAFGVGDYSVAMQAPQTAYGAPDPDYGVLTDADGAQRAFHWNDQWHFALARIANACRAHGLRPIDGPFTSIDDPAGYVAAARRSRALGYEGKWAIHPSQVESANAVFSPSAEDLGWAAQVGEAMAASIAGGRGATRLDGRMVDLAHVRQADALLARQRLIESGAGRP